MFVDTIELEMGKLAESTLYFLFLCSSEVIGPRDISWFKDSDFSNRLVDKIDFTITKITFKIQCRVVSYVFCIRAFRNVHFDSAWTFSSSKSNPGTHLFVFDDFEFTMKSLYYFLIRKWLDWTF